MAVMTTVLQQFIEERISGAKDEEPRTVPLTIRVSPSSDKQLKQYASVLRVTPSMLARRLLEAGLQETEAEIKRLTTKRGKG